MNRFVWVCIGVVALAVSAAAPACGMQSVVRVVLVLSSEQSLFEQSVRSGAEVGAAEAVHTAGLNRTSFEFRELHLPAAGGSLSPASRTELDSADIVISALDAGKIEALSGRRIRALLLDVSAPGAEMDCADLHLRLSAPATALAGGAMWQAGLQRYGAAQLNERYRRATGKGMDEGAWLGWFATKVAVELTLRARTTTPDSLAAFARSSRGRFDGQKGRPLTFARETGLLVQPLYVRQEAAQGAELEEQFALPGCRARAP
jgi:hypothetical protein